VATLTGGEATPVRGKRGDDISWANENLTGVKNKKNHTIDSVSINGR
jgi:hypothetical protein